MKFFCVFFALGFLFAKEPPAFYENLSSLTAPKRADYLKIQEYNRRKNRVELKLLKTALQPGGNLYDYHERAKRFRMVGKMPWQGAQFHTAVFGVGPANKKRCVISYASYNQRYPRGVHLIEKALEKGGFQGHFVYRIGGWPDLEGGSLTLAHVPYAFKPCFLREVEKMGYESVLWLDASIRPLTNLEEIFERIESDGFLFYSAGHTLEKYCTKEVFESLGEPIENGEKITSVAAGIFGVNLKHPSGKKIADAWYEAARKEIPFFSPRPDQNPLSILLHQMGILKRGPSEELAFEEGDCVKEAKFWIDHSSIQ